MSVAKRFLNSLRAVSQQRYPEWLLRTAEAQRWEVPELVLPEAQAELYQRLNSVSVAVGTVAQLGSTAGLNVKRASGEKSMDEPNHEFEQLWRRPNPVDSRSEFMIGTLSYLKLTGNYYWWLNRTNPNEKPLELWLIPSWQIRPVPDGRMYLAGYEYDPGDGNLMMLPTWQISHGRRFHPRNRWVGMSLIEALATDATADMAMQRWNANYFGKDNAKIPGALAFSDFVQDPQWEKIKADAKAGWGSTNRSGPMMLRGAGAGGVQWVAMALSQQEMEFLAGRQFLKEEVWSGMAPGLSSMLAINANEANARVGKGILIEFAVWPDLVGIAEKITNDIMPAYGSEYTAEFEDIRITDRAIEIQEQQAFAACHTIDEVRSEFYDDKPLGDPRGDLLPAQVSPTTPGPGMEELEPEPKPVPAALQPFAGQDPANGQQQPMGSQDQQVKDPKTAGGQPSEGDDEIDAATKATYQYASTQVDLPDDAAAAIRAFAATIPDSDLAADGRESEPHVTILYGITDDSPNVAARMLESYPSVGLALGETAVFPDDGSKGYDVVYVRIDSYDLEVLHERLLNNVPHIEPTYRKYTPHATIAYVKPGLGRQYADKFVCAYRYVTCASVIFSAANGTRTIIPFVGDALKADLAKWQTKALNRLRRDKPAACEFESESIPQDVAEAIYEGLKGAETAEAVKAVFADLEGAAKAQHPFARTGQAIHDGDDAARQDLEVRSTKRIAGAFRDVLKAIIPADADTAHVSTQDVIARYQQNTGPLRDALLEMLIKAAQLGVDGGLRAVEQVQGTAKAVMTPTAWLVADTEGSSTDITTAWDLPNQAAREWVGRYLFDLLEGINRTTVTALQTAISDWIENGLPLSVLVDELSGPRGPFSRQRAEMIAMTEVTRAYAQGNIEAWKASGVITRMQWRTANDERVCPICGPLGGMEFGDDGPEPASPQEQWARGVTTEIDGSFHHPGGGGTAGKHAGRAYQAPPAHPRCRCWLVPVV